jgi:hypothetical protein
MEINYNTSFSAVNSSDPHPSKIAGQMADPLMDKGFSNSKRKGDA